ncbi:hypothetical protein IMSAG025_02295 [Muribaculaceae bacterium]|nr:hypothetical protein IMSAG025_02295 [Muribaculaceae bacterium]
MGYCFVSINIGQSPFFKFHPFRRFWPFQICQGILKNSSFFIRLWNHFGNLIPIFIQILHIPRYHTVIVFRLYAHITSLRYLCCLVIRSVQLKSGKEFFTPIFRQLKGVQHIFISRVRIHKLRRYNRFYPFLFCNIGKDHIDTDLIIIGIKIVVKTLVVPEIELFISIKFRPAPALCACYIYVFLCRQ